MRIKAITALILCGVMMTACAGKTTEQHTEQITEQNDKQNITKSVGQQIEEGYDAYPDDYLTDTREGSYESSYDQYGTGDSNYSYDQYGTGDSNYSYDQYGTGDSDYAYDQYGSNNTYTQDYTNDTGYSDVYYSFNPHVCAALDYDSYREEAWNAFFNMCDALREGRDSFECADEVSFNWCFSGVLDKLFPGVAPFVDSDNCSFSNGVGHIAYLIPADEVVVKEQEFEREIENVLSQCVTKDYTDFEKCLAIYEYMAKNISYDDEKSDVIKGVVEDDLTEYGSGVSSCLYNKKGVCADIAITYTYLLLQCGVDAITFGYSGHIWSYVRIDGSEYHIDPTWTTSHGDVRLSYFLMTDEERLASIGNRKIYPLKYRYEYYTPMSYRADDTRYEEINCGKFISMDRDNKIVYYELNREMREFHYE